MKKDDEEISILCQPLNILFPEAGGINSIINDYNNKKKQVFYQLYYSGKTVEEIPNIIIENLRRDYLQKYVWSKTNGKTPPQD